MVATLVDKSELRGLIADVLDISPEALTDEAHFVDDLGVDSLIALELSVTLERRYQIKVEESEMAALQRLGDVQALLESKLTAA